MTHMHWTRDTQNRVWLTLDQQGSGINTLSSDVLIELSRSIDVIEESPPAALIIRSAKPSGFIAGADVNQFTEIPGEQAARDYILQAHKIMQKIERMACPTIALIQGFCLGGGLELALACRYRIADAGPDTRIGFPEVKLGIFPGFGGTVRSIARIGPLRALPLMLSGRTLDGHAARRLGLVDMLVPERQLLNAVDALLHDHPAAARPPAWQALFNHTPLRQLAAAYLRQATAARVNPQHYPAPFRLIDHWKHAGGDAAALYRSEADHVSRLLCEPVSRNLIHVFRLQEKLKRLGHSDHPPVNHLHVIGGGVMGGDIAAWCALRGMRVTLQDREAGYLTRAMKRAHELFRKRLKQAHRIQAAGDRLIPDPAGYGLARADLVIEAIYEDREAKRDLYRRIEPQMKADALLASNTSSIPLEELQPVLQRPERLIGLHFFNPVAKMQLVEVVRSEQSDPAMIERGCAFVKQIGRLPLPVRSSPGFLVNRILMPYLLEAVDLYEEGVPAESIDRAAIGFGMPMGPIELADSVGLDICLSVAEKLSSHYQSEVPETLRRLVEAGSLGRKSGQGFYRYDRKGRRQRHWHWPGKASDTLADRMLLRLLNEAVACLREGIVDDEDLLDAGVIFGTGFAPFRGGPLHYIHQFGSQRMQSRLNEFEKTLGHRFAAVKGWSAIA